MNHHHDLVAAFLPMTVPSPLALPDSWIARSVMQKAIRRAETELAGRAAVTLLRMDRTATWQRLLLIAYEDVGIGGLDAVVATTTMMSVRNRRNLGDDALVAAAIARMLASAIKDRGAEGLSCAAIKHPALGPLRHLLATLAIPHVLGMVRDSSLPLVERAVAAWNASGVDSWPNRRVGPGDLSALLRIYQSLGVKEEILGGVATAIRRVREPMFVIFPLLVLAMDKGHIVDNPPQPMPMIGDLPLCALDKFTRIGKEAIARFATTTPSIMAALNDLLPYRLWAKATGFGVFYAEGGRVFPRLAWSQSAAIERVGIEADFMSIGFPADAVTDFLALVEVELPHLNAIRTRLLSSSPGAATEYVSHDAHQNGTPS
ncbi:hypothetical protein A6A04_19485 [Paramagnetospirillum marisnigri]|uniref:Uncharacterized protein n=1 Tax=Paramagnetospirillum marisnigri TaxID=1285242 RepID=A0A178ML09_9PROT|nr:hypothetical protein [Paramagnetospirillum marisnigri]OAN49411.1 hypothetical protein A6A04_19485 [Paramagnetospirillum marisnigri]